MITIYPNIWISKSICHLKINLTDDVEHAMNIIWSNKTNCKMMKKLSVKTIWFINGLFHFMRHPFMKNSTIKTVAEMDSFIKLRKVF